MINLWSTKTILNGIISKFKLFPITIKFTMFHSENTLKQIPFSFVLCNFGGAKHATLSQIIFDIFVESKNKQDSVKPSF